MTEVWDQHSSSKGSSPRSGFFAASSPIDSPAQPSAAPTNALNHRNGFISADSHEAASNDADRGYRRPIKSESSFQLPPWMHRVARAWLVWRWRMASNVFALPLPYWTAHWDIKRGDLLITLPLILILVVVNAVVALAGEDVGGSGTLPEITMAAVFVFAVRNNSVLLAATGISFERALFYHKLAAVVTIVLSALHAIAYLLDDHKRRHKHYSDSKVVTGTIAFFAMVALYLFTLNVIRRRFFELFVRLHWILFIVALLFTVIHGAVVVLVGAVPWVVDVMFRVVYRPRVYASGSVFHSKRQASTDGAYTAEASNTLPSRLGVIARDQVRVCKLPGGVTSIQFPRVRADTREAFKFSAGQYAFLCIPEIGMLEWHPFTISSAPHEDTVSFHIRSVGDWTSRLAHLVPESSANAPAPATFDLFVDGPYGRLSIDLDGYVPEIQYTHVVMICGGIGITPMRSIVNQLHFEALNEKKRPSMRSVRLVWAIRELDLLDAFMTSVEAPLDGGHASYMPHHLLARTSGTPTASLAPNFRTDIFVTSKLRVDPAGYTETGRLLDPMVQIGERPHVEQILREIGESVNPAAGDRVAVLVCGPDTMVKDVIAAGILLTRETGVRFDVHHEYFSF